MKILLVEGVVEAMRAHSEAAYPNECCGILIGSFGADSCRLMRAVPAANVFRGNTEDRYEVDPLAILKVEKELAGKVERIAGFFHSHPQSPPYPSSMDLEMARGVFDAFRFRFVYAIVVLEELCVFWRLDADAQKFEKLVAVPIP